MTHNTYEIERFALPLPITEAARTLADNFANQQPTPTKAEQVRLNTVAVWVVNSYLQLMGVPTDWSHSDSHNAYMRLWGDVADLNLPDIGKLECRPVKPDAQTCWVPPEVWEQRVGYVVVQLDEPLQQAKILGFTPTVATEALPLNLLHAPEDLLDHLEALHPVTVIDPLLQGATQLRSHLSRWLEDVVESGWQTVDWLLNQPELAPAYAFRGREAGSQEQETGIKRLKLLHLGHQPGEMSVILLVNVDAIAATDNNPAALSIRLQVYPISQRQLPAGLRLTILDDAQQSFLQATSRAEDNYMQLEISGVPGEAFGVQVAFESVEVTEAFVI